LEGTKRTTTLENKILYIRNPGLGSIRGQWPSRNKYILKGIGLLLRRESGQGIGIFCQKTKCSYIISLLTNDGDGDDLLSQDSRFQGVSYSLPKKLHCRIKLYTQYPNRSYFLGATLRF
ncbi:unnamed protein product, partial [Choristocarpus tenellus]